MKYIVYGVFVCSVALIASSIFFEKMRLDEASQNCLKQLMNNPTSGNEPQKCAEVRIHKKTVEAIIGLQSQRPN
jgi:hypothetical protein